MSAKKLCLVDGALGHTGSFLVKFLLDSGEWDIVATDLQSEDRAKLMTKETVFSKDLKLSGVIIAKLDSSAKGGMIFSIKNELNIPILYSGLGEKLENISVFDPHSFINGLFG